jgi:hypothetical protein
MLSASNSRRTLSCLHAVSREEFNAKAPRRHDARRILRIQNCLTKRCMLLGESIPLASFPPPRLWIFALRPCCIVPAKPYPCSNLLAAHDEAEKAGRDRIGDRLVVFEPFVGGLSPR